MIIRYDDGSHRLTAACLIGFMTPRQTSEKNRMGALARPPPRERRCWYRTPTAIVEIELFLERRTYNIRKPSVSD
jgi:hypothetical protein